MSEQAWPAQCGADDPDMMLVWAMAHGDEKALDELYARHGASLLVYLIGRMGDRQLAEDVLQEVMLAAWKGASRFRGESKVRTWLLAIARHRAINAQRGHRLPCTRLDETIATSDVGPLDALVRDVERDETRMALQELPPDQQETLELIFYHGLSGPEVAAIQGVAPGTVKSRLHRAKAALRKLLSSKETTNA